MRNGFTSPSDSDYFNLEVLFNDLTRVALASNTKRALAVAILDQNGNHVSASGSVGGTTTNRVVSIVNGVATDVSPTDGTVREIHIINDTGQTLRYGGSSVDGSSGGYLYDKSTMVFKNPDSDFVLYFFQNSGADKDLDIVEMY